MAKTIVLNSTPSIPKLYLRALFARKSRQAPPQERELGRVSLSALRPDSRSLNTYRDVCGFSSQNTLPVSFPFVLAAPLQLELLVSDAFPFPILGIVHTKNSVTQYRRIREGEPLDIECILQGPRPALRGLEFDLHTRISVGSELVWECVCTLLRRERAERRRRGRGARNGTRHSADFTPDATVDWNIPADTGRRYAAASGDRNPIHMSALTAKLFGFPRAIAHGMWTKAHCLAELDPVLPEGAFTVDVDFKLPILLPAEVQFQYCATEAGIEFAVKDRAGKRPHLLGGVTAI
ncbi:MaoC/PaaZ C-terminal domain-containing protein [Microbulbifer hainanensis]|uniref:MaoC/PaaZ C-terminal domain-containing protein n=1 Tax=Microbulbifer hainanensis TaxID=2735675 RepID=UPI001868030D|nr:MaoC/PaaZ C-terminal domain-containing protein [Microbulbifer hainanensis]